MNQTEYQKLIYEIDLVYIKTVEEAQQKKDKARSAIDGLFAFAGKPLFGNIKQAVEDAIEKANGSFTTKDLRLLVDSDIKLHPGTLSNYLHRWHKQGKIRLIKQGSGSVGSTFEKIIKEKELRTNPQQCL